MTPLLWIVAGVALAHVLWAAVFVGWWYLLIRRSPDETSKQVQQDFKTVRDSIRSAKQRARNMDLN